jgi:hypothetical protein
VEDRRRTATDPAGDGRVACGTLPGALGQPGTSVQIGGTSVSLPMELGGRFALGTWI